ncbi:MAG TPA: hypothetical protein VL202_14400 [Pararhizobium sp.]|uniref:hypothetical protein n=1 Tax=Pararhizobium sp. TaxID=1977563 RepID=UPI002C0ED706|nr:hypothetical protein [Pararhizobium sp.]HTO32345.1 hypothetical protein [Pararhizobium sp.]
MQSPSPGHLEGRLNAHRKLLVAMAAFIAESSEGRAFLMHLSRDSETVSDHEEDPGIEPDSSFATQQIADDEMQSIIKAAQSRSLAVERQDEQRRRDVAP